MRSRLLAIVASLGLCSAASAQVVYEPVQSQYRSGITFYYGGQNPRVFEHAREIEACRTDHRADYLPRVTAPAQLVFSDCLPRLNAYAYGYTSTDARNEAFARVPRFFRMADLLAGAVPSVDGPGVEVPPQAFGDRSAGLVEIRARDGSVIRNDPVRAPQPILIIPKSLLREPSRNLPKGGVTTAR